MAIRRKKSRSSALKCVVNGLRRGAAVERLQGRRLDLDEARLVERAADLADRLGAGDEDVARLLVGDQVQLAAAEAGLDVGQPVVLLGRRPQRLGEQRDVLERDRQLAGARADDRAVGADQVAEVEVRQAAELLLAEHVLPAEQLDAPRAVDEVQERGLALPAARGDAAGHADAHLGLTAGLQVVVALARLGDRDDAVELVRERVHARGADLLQLAPSCGEDLCFAAAEGGASLTRRRSS